MLELSCNNYIDAVQLSTISALPHSVPQQFLRRQYRSLKGAMKMMSILFATIASFICIGSKVNGYSSEGFTLGVRDSIMIAHSFLGEEFGPAQSLHGATYTVDVELSTSDLVEKVNWVVDIGEFSTILSDVLGHYNFKNLNELFPDENTTTEFMCRRIHGDIAAKLKCKDTKASLSVKLHESHKAWASYSNRLQ